MGLFDFLKKKRARPMPQSQNATPMANFTANHDFDDIHFKNKKAKKCAECMRKIQGHVWQIGPKSYCQECFNRRVTLGLHDFTAQKLDFEMVIDDVFSIKNHGVTVTGTIKKGCIDENDTVVINGCTFTVNQIHVRTNETDHATAGMNVGLLLSTMDAGLFKRGDVVTLKAMPESQAKTTFVCDVCKKELPIKYCHKGNTCVTCAESKTVHTTQPMPQPLTTASPAKFSTDEYLDDIMDSCDKKESDSAIDNAVASLRNQIIAQITKNPAVKYQLASLLWQDAANCFPKSGFQWDGAWFKLDLQTGKLSADVATYPNQFGACYEDSFPLSATAFNRIAKQYLSKELQAFRSDEDWAKLFDDRLKSVVSSTCAKLRRQDEDRKNEEIKKNAVKIPAEYAKQTPDMCLSEITIEISQRYSSSSIEVSNENGNYQIVYVRYSHMSPSIDRYPRALSAVEAVWLEKQVENTIRNPDESTWQSLPGGDIMNIVIKRNKGNDISLRGVKPIKKYSDLQNELENLAQYGSSSLQ